MICGSLPIVHSLYFLNMLEISEFYFVSLLSFFYYGRLTIGFSVFEFHSWDPMFKENINLTECTVLAISLVVMQTMTPAYLGLGKPEPTPDKREEIGSCIEESSAERSPAPSTCCLGLDHSWSHRIGENAGQVVDKST